MHINHLSLTNFRNFGRLELRFPTGANLLYGANAQGKTNLLEAIYYLATTKSPYTHQDDQLINWEAGQYDELVVVGRIVAHVQTNIGIKHLELRLIREINNGNATFRREALIDRRKVRLMDMLGNLRVVLFLPEDMSLITGPPANRRRYLDVTLCQSDAVYCRTLSRYNKVLEQRNALLKQLALSPNNRGKNDLLNIFTDKLVELGSQIFARRACFMTELAREVQHIHYERLTAGQESLKLSYLPRLESKSLISDGIGETAVYLAHTAWLYTHHQQIQPIKDRFRDALKTALTYDRVRGTTSVGPHRDDWYFEVNKRSLRNYGSRGQQRSAILALKMGEVQWVSAETNDTPLLLLDDVMAELDAKRRNLLVTSFSDVTQAFITSADTTIFPSTFLQETHTMSVVSGRVQPSPIE